VYFVNFSYNLYMFRTSQICHQEETLYLCDTWYLLFCIADCLVCRIEFHPAYRTVSQKYSCSSSWWTWRGPKYV